MQRIKTSTLWTAAPICLFAGNALGQTYDQGTIDRQRLRLDDTTIAPSTNGWLNDSQTPRFWAWELNASVNDTYKHPNMQRWIQHRLWASSLSDGSINTTSLDQQAQSIANEIVNRYNSSGNDAIVDGEYAICLLGFTRIDLHDHLNDDLDDSILLWNPDLTPQPGAEPWANFVTSSETPTRASGWRSNGVLLADTAIEYLTDEIVARVKIQIPSFPVPIRLFFDEERGRQHGPNSLDNFGAMESVLSDIPRVYLEPMFGNYNLWDSTPTYTTALEVFTNVPFASMLGWNDALSEYVPHAPIPQYNGTQNPDGTWVEPSHQGPHFDFEFYPMYNLYNNIISTSIDGSLEAAIDHPLTDPSWGNPKWSNYNTSVYFSSAYPKLSRTRRGVLHGAWPPHRAFGWTQAEQIGSGSIQSPVLYPPSDFHEEELESDFYPDPGIVIPTQSEKEARAWLRYSRMQLDHLIFSFTELDNTIGFSAPRHIAPWVTRVGTPVYRTGYNFNDHNITTKDNVRDIVALCKAKGINEILFWGNLDFEYFTTDDGCNTGNTNDEKSQHNWDSTNDLLSQVYDYTLNAVWFNTGNRDLTADEIKSLTFSEEHALDLNPTLGRITQVQFSAEFDIGSITTLGDQYTVICEVLDGGGPWANATYTLEIYNYKTTSYQTITDASIEWYSNSTRRVEFSDADSNGYADDWLRPFDDQIALPANSTVYDRKKITVWKNFTLPIGSAQINNYTQSGKMKVRITANHSTPVQIGQTPDPLRVDLIQLYETECANNNITAAPQPLLGDMNGDQQIDAADLMMFMQDFVSNPSSNLDINDDNQVDINDIKAMNNLIR